MNESGWKGVLFSIAYLILSNIRGREIHGLPSRFYHWYSHTNDIPISFKVLPIIDVFCNTICANGTNGTERWLPIMQTRESHMIQYGVLNSRFINFTNKHCFYLP